MITVLLLALWLEAAASADATHSTTILQQLPATSLVDAQHDSLRNSHKVIYIDGQPSDATTNHLDSIRRVIDLFYYDQFSHFSDPAAPYFLFMSKDAKLAMGIGGCVRMRGWYDWGGALPANGFSPALIPIHPDPANMKRLGTTPAGTCLFFRVIGRNKVFGQYQLYIEANFNGYQGRDFHLKKAYAQVNDWTIGYASSTFADPSALAPTVDASGANNKIDATSVLVRWMHSFARRWTVAASLETPSTQPTQVEGFSSKAGDWLPDVAAFLQYSWGRSSHLRLSGILRSLNYRNLVENKNHTVPGWAVQLSGTGHITDAITVYGTVNGGRGYGSLGGDLLTGTYDLVPVPGVKGELYAPYSVGWNLGLQYNFLRNLFCSVTIAECRYLPRSGVAPDEYKLGRYLAANIFWNLTERIQVGAEYNQGERRNIDGARRSARRVGLMAQFSF